MFVLYTYIYGQKFEFDVSFFFFYFVYATFMYCIVPCVLLKCLYMQNVNNKKILSSETFRGVKIIYNS